MTQPLIVTAAIIRKKDKILITKRPEGSREAGKWEFPGGKLNDNESPEDCLQRELVEELNLQVKVEAIFEVLHHRYSWGPILLLAFECHPLSNKIENIQVAEHRYVPIKSLHNYDFLEADKPIIDKLIQESDRSPAPS